MGNCKFYQPCPTRTTIKDAESEQGLASLTEAFCDSNCDTCPTYEFLESEGIDFKRIVGYAKPKESSGSILR